MRRMVCCAAAVVDKPSSNVKDRTSFFMKASQFRFFPTLEPSEAGRGEPFLARSSIARV